MKTNILRHLLKYSFNLNSQTLLPLIIGYPASVSVNQLIHFAQEVRSSHFRQYDYGYIGNLRKYKQLEPPDYDLSNIKTPIALYYAHDDWLADCKDVDKLSQLLPNVINDYLIPHARFNHLDFLFGVDVQHLVYDKLLDILNATVNQIMHNC